MINFDDPKPTAEEVARIMAAYPKERFEERVTQIMRGHSELTRAEAEEIITNVITTKEQPSVLPNREPVSGRN